MRAHPPPKGRVPKIRTGAACSLQQPTAAYSSSLQAAACSCSRMYCSKQAAGGILQAAIAACSSTEQYILQQQYNTCNMYNMHNMYDKTCNTYNMYVKYV